MAALSQNRSLKGLYLASVRRGGRRGEGGGGSTQTSMNVSVRGPSSVSTDEGPRTETFRLMKAHGPKHSLKFEYYEKVHKRLAISHVVMNLYNSILKAYFLPKTSCSQVGGSQVTKISLNTSVCSSAYTVVSVSPKSPNQTFTRWTNRTRDCSAVRSVPKHSPSIRCCIMCGMKSLVFTARH